MTNETITIIYDGECPLCRFGVKRVFIPKESGEVLLLNAREGQESPVMQEIKRRGLDLDEGMVVIIGDNYFHGADAVHALALLSTPGSWFNRVNTKLFRSKTLSQWVYPSLKAGRRMALWAKSVPLLRDAGK